MKPRTPTHGPNTRYNTVYHYATTLDELSTRCGRYGEAAVAEAQWEAVTFWLMQGAPGGELPCSIDVALTATDLCRGDDRACLSLPNWKGGGFASLLQRLSAESQAEARQVASAVRTAWETAGSPGLHPARFKAVQQYISGCLQRLDQE